MVTYHADVEKYGLIKRCYQPFIQRFLAKMDRIVVTSRQYLDSSTDLKPFRHKCRVIPLSLDTRRFTLPDAKIMETTEKKYGRDFFLFVGVLRHYKGISFLLDAMQQVKGSLIIVGKGKEKAGLERQCRQLGLKNVRFTGYVEDRYLPAFYTLCRAFVFPSISRSEAFGVSLLEASYFARPMITTELSTGTSFVNRHRLTGLIVPPRDPIALQHAMNTLHDEPLLCQTYGENAGKRFNSHFTADISGSLYMDMYKKILQSSHQYRK